MNQWITVLQIIISIFAAVGLGVLAKRKNMISAGQMQGLQRYVMKFGLPCVVFNSCYGAKISAEAVTSMALVVPLVLLSSVWAFRSREKWGGYHNFPMIFSAKDSCGEIFRIAGMHFALFAVFCGIMQGILLLLGDVEAQTRWAVLLYCALPASYLSPGLGRNEREYTVSSGVCSVLTVISLAIFCAMAALVA